MTLAEYSLFDGTGLAELVRGKHVTPAELTDIALRAVERVNPLLNIIAHDLGGQAREVAEKGPPPGPFAGVPFMIKDLALEMKDTPYEAGCRLLKGNVSLIDTNLMTQFKAAGLVTIAKSTCAEFGAQLTTETVLNGVTRSPWNLAHTPGGSSGGSAAAVAAGVVPFAHANDGIGSIRIPASNCGLFGLKPNRQRLPLGPMIGDAPGSRGVEFVVTRSVRDAARLLDAVHGPDIGAHSWAPPPERPYREELERPRTGLRIAMMTKSFSGASIHPECVRAVQETAALCEALGHHVEEAAPTFDFEGFRHAIRLESNANSAAALEMVGQMMGRPPSPDNLEPFTWRIYQEGKAASAEAYAMTQFTYGVMQRQMGAFFERFDILLTPVLATPPAEIGWLGANPDDIEGFWDRFCGDAYSPFVGVFNVTGPPAASIPLHVSDSGLPIGTQAVARFGDEGALLNLAAQLEAAQPWIDRRPAIHVSTLR